MAYINAEMRRQIIERAGNCCEYCRVSREDRSFPYQVDHIIAEKHNGPSTLDNLCWSCYLCNGYKGSDIGSIDWEGDEGLVPLFNPRIQVWDDHFQLDLDTALLHGITPAGRVTVKLLRLNEDEHIRARRLLLQLGRYPCERIRRR